VAEWHEPPPQWDLRQAGWPLVPAQSGPADIVLVDARNDSARRWAECPADRASCLFLGVECGRERARLLDSGAGDALPADVDLAELAQRARRIAAARDSLPRRREIGPLTLDLFHRDARAGQRWLALHPREFELLWRLAERPGEKVSRARLLREVWRVDFEPGTNTVEVHVSRLRAKLAAVGAQGVVETDPAGGYRVPPLPAFAERAEERLCA
jgi:DNA-binding response OmpR family regulator